MTLTDDRAGSTTAGSRLDAVHPLIADRWSPRAFDPAPLGDDDVALLLEAARWAPSSRNHQPWRFLVGRDGDSTHAGLLAAMAPPNRAWAQRAPLLIAALVRRTDDGVPSHGAYELGLAVAQLTAQAQARGLHVHQIGGFDTAAVEEPFGVPDEFAAVVLLAVGRTGDPALLPDWARGREGAERERLPLEGIAFSGRFGSPLPLDDGFAA